MQASYAVTTWLDFVAISARFITRLNCPFPLLLRIASSELGAALP